MRNFLSGVVFTLLVVILGVFAYLRLGFAEVRGDLPPSNWEKALMFSSAHASVRRRAPELPNPVPSTDENLIAGAKIYSDECSGCHGAAGKADQTGDSLYPPIPQLPVAGTTYTEAQIFWVAKHGVPIGHVRERQMGFRPETLDRGCLHQADQIAASSSPARARQARAAKIGVTMKRPSSIRIWGLGRLSLFLPAFFVVTSCVDAQTPSLALLILEKDANTVAIVDPASLKIVGRVPAGPDPHEVESSPDGKLAYISNYGGSDSALHTISVVDLIAQKALPPIDLGALHSPHGLAFAGGKLYFTAETNKVVGRYDPATQTIDWLIGTGQDRSHMVVVSAALDRVFTSNVSSGTISIIEQASAPNPGPPPGATPPSGGPPPGSPRKTWRVTNVGAGRGSEGFDLSPDGKEIWAANAQDGSVTIIDVATKKATRTFPIPVRGNRLKFTPDGKRVLVSGGPSVSAGANLVILDAVTHKEVRSFDFGGGSAGILIVPDGSRAYVAVSAKDKVAVVDLKKLEVDGYIATRKGPDGLAWAERK